MAHTEIAHPLELNASLAPKWKRYAGIGFTILPAAMLLMSAAMKFSGNPQMVAMISGKFGYPATLLPILGVLELASVVLYLIPRTAILGAILLTGYLGGAVATHVRVSDPFLVPLLIGVVAWIGLYLRDQRVRALLPLRKQPDRV